MIATLEEIVGSPLFLEELKHKPGRRRTLRAAGPRRRAIVKAYRSDRASVVAARVRVLAAGPEEPEVPRVLHVDRGRRLVVLQELPGPPLRTALLSGDLDECARAGVALGRWHAFWQGKQPGALVPHTAAREVEILSSWATRAQPSIGVRVRRATAPLTAEWPISTVVHRDLYEEQIILGPRVGLIDLDDAALGPAELDLGNLLAHVQLLALRTARELSPAGNALLEGYETFGPRLDGSLLARCTRLSRLRLACIHGERELLDVNNR